MEEKRKMELRCSYCDVIKAITHYYPLKGKRGYTYYCKECKKKQNKDSYTPVTKRKRRQARPRVGSRHCVGESSCGLELPLSSFDKDNMRCDECLDRLLLWAARFKNKQALQDIEKEDKQYKNKKKQAKKAFRTPPINHTPRYWS